jgi:murein DD-endopeptidase MepM/ murein hydrolase activator NlpD
MQFIWISGPVGRIRSVELTAKKLLVVASIFLAVAFFVITSLNLVGARAIFNLSPELVQRLGGLITVAEQQAREAEFNSEISQIRTALKQMERELQKAEEFKFRLQNLVSRDPKEIGRTSGAFNSSIFSDSKPGGRGGPFIPGDAKGVGRDDNGQPGVGPSSDAGTNGLVTPEVRRLSARAEQLKSTADRLSQAWASNFEMLSGLPLAVPVDHERADTDVSSGFGYRRDPFNGQRAFHAGLDFSAPPGTPVYATADGIVIEVSNSPGYGRTVIIEHPSGFMTLYAHMSTIRVKQGERVKRHAVIGGIGSTGRSTGPHLHYEVLSKSKAAINPKFFLSALGD